VRETASRPHRSQFYYLALGVQGSLVAYMFASFFLSVPFNWYVYYLVGYAVCLRRTYEAETGQTVVVESRKARLNRQRDKAVPTNSTAGAAA
jgi:hypothetical protein